MFITPPAHGLVVLQLQNAFRHHTPVHGLVVTPVRRGFLDMGLLRFQSLRFCSMESLLGWVLAQAAIGFVTGEVIKEREGITVGEVILPAEAPAQSLYRGQLGLGVFLDGQGSLEKVRVTTTEVRCSCPGFHFRKRCKHIRMLRAAGMLD